MDGHDQCGSVRICDRFLRYFPWGGMMAVALHNTPGGESKKQADLYCYYSYDNDRTWFSSAKVPNTTEIITQEPGLIELKGGRIMMYIRASGGLQQLSFSSDKGKTWSHIEPSKIASPLSPASIKKIPATGDWLLAWNNNDGSSPEIKDMRTPLTIAVSSDEGKTWRHIKNIHSDTYGWYCYTGIHFMGKHILLVYCAGTRKAHLSTVNIARLSLGWIYW